jgi:hypothetical protein
MLYAYRHGNDRKAVFGAACRVADQANAGNWPLPMQIDSHSLETLIRMALDSVEYRGAYEAQAVAKGRPISFV